MNLNVKNFKNILRKATLNLSISSVQLKFEEGKIISNMVSDDRDAIVVINIDNDVMSGDNVEFNFSDPSQNLIPYLDLVDVDDIDIEIKNEKIVMTDGSQKSNIHFCSPTVVSVFGSREPRESTEYFTDIEIDENFIEIFKKIKKIGARFNKIYITVDNNKLIIETTDKTNRFSNGIKFDIKDVEYDNMTMHFDYKNFSNLVTVIGNQEGFKMNFAYIKDQEMGMIYVTSEDRNENYYLMSKEL